MTIIAILGQDDSFAAFIVMVDNFGEGAFGDIESHKLRIYFALIIDLNPHNSVLVAGCQICILIKILIFVTVFLQPDPVLSFLFGQFLLFLHLRVKGYLRCIFFADFYQLIHDFAFREGE